MRRRERGAVAVVIAIVLALLLGFLALSLETGHVLSAKGELQNAADAAALAGAKRLDGTNEISLQGAVSEAERYARAHPTDQYDAEPSTVQLGSWTPPELTCPAGSAAVGETTPDGYRFCGFPGTAADPAVVNAVRVVTMRSGEAGQARGGGAVEHPFGAFVGQAQTEVAAEAIAVTGSPASQGCPELPFAIKRSCVANGGVVDCNGGQPILFYVGLASSGIDSAGLTIFQEAACDDSTGTDTKFNGSSGWGTGAVCDVLNDRCENHPAVGKCISIKNGDNVAGSCGAGVKICDLLRDKVGEVGQVPLVEYAEGEDCAGGFGDFNYVHSAKIVGIGSVRLVGAQCLTGSNKGIVALPGYEAAVSQCQFANGSCFVMEFVCGQTDDDETGVGYGFTGTTVLQPILVR